MAAMRKSRLSQHKQDRLLEHFVSGTTTRCAASLIRVNVKTRAYYFHRLREIIAYHLKQEADTVFSGEIEVDENYFGGRRKGKRSRGAGGKNHINGIENFWNQAKRHMRKFNGVPTFPWMGALAETPSIRLDF